LFLHLSLSKLDLSLWLNNHQFFFFFSHVVIEVC
jgi:hypothetical protein